MIPPVLESPGLLLFSFPDLTALLSFFSASGTLFNLTPALIAFITSSLLSLLLVVMVLGFDLVRVLVSKLLICPSKLALRSGLLTSEGGVGGRGLPDRLVGGGRGGANGGVGGPDCGGGGGGGPL